MKHRTKILATLGIVTGLAVSGYALTSVAHEKYHARFGSHDARQHDMSGGRHHKGAKRMMRMLETYDSNGDNALTLEEVTSERGRKFKQFDTNGDGTLDIGEYQGLWMDAMRERMVDRFQKHDNDGDGKITEADFSSRYNRMMKWMDRNGDGKVDRDDVHRGHHGGAEDKDKS